MNAWQRLLAASSLAIGTAWDLITHPKTGGAGVIVNTGSTALVQDGSLAASVIPDAALAVVLANEPIQTLLTTPLDMRVADQSLAVAVSTADMTINP